MSSTSPKRHRPEILSHGITTNNNNTLSLEYNLIFSLLLAGRLLLSLTPLPGVLKNSQQLSTTLSSYDNLREGIYLFNNGIDPYNGGTFRHSPLFLSLFSTVLPSSRGIASILWTFSDGVGAWALVKTLRARQRVSSGGRTKRDGLVAALYLLNPYIFLPALALSTGTFDNALLLLTIMFASTGESSLSLLSLSFLLHLSPSTLILIIPILLLLITDPTSHLAAPHPFSANLSKAIPHVNQLCAFFVVLTALSTWIAGGWGWVGQTWGTSIMLPDLAPNTGMWWYFFTEMFDHFRPFFLMVFSVHLLIYVIPICIKFQHDPLYATFLLVGVLGMFKAYPTLSDPGIFLSMISIFPEIYSYLRHPIVTLLLHLHASLLLPLFHHLWLVQGTGNANFFYASTLVFACANGAALIDCIWAGLRIGLGQGEGKAYGWVVTQE